MNGEYGVSDMHLCDLHYHAYSKAAWQSDGTLKLWIRPVETAHVRQFTFKFDGNNVQIKNDMQPRFEELAIYNMTFWACPCRMILRARLKSLCMIWGFRLLNRILKV